LERTDAVVGEGERLERKEPRETLDHRDAVTGHVEVTQRGEALQAAGRRAQATARGRRAGGAARACGPGHAGDLVAGQAEIREARQQLQMLDRRQPVVVEVQHPDLAVVELARERENLPSSLSWGGATCAFDTGKQRTTPRNTTGLRA